MPELKPCPFFGGTKVLLRKLPQKILGNELWGCECLRCGVKSAVQYGKKKATEAWNRRGENDATE